MKKIFNYIIIFFAIFLFLPIVNASVETKERTDFDNYGVNKKWEINTNNKIFIL